jgi:glycosyltransferase involved in cell wall biosynthesis
MLVWQWGRFGAGPALGADFAAGFSTVPGVTGLLSLSTEAEIMRLAPSPRCDLPVATYHGPFSYLARAATSPVLVPRLARELRRLAPDLALCAMPGPLDLAMHSTLRRAGVPYAVVVHDADTHPGDGYPLQMTLQRLLVNRADAVVVLSDHVHRRLTAQGLAKGKQIIRSVLPPPAVGMPPPVRAHGGRFRLLSFGRLLPYKGLDLLAAALAKVLPEIPMAVRVVGRGPESAHLAALRRLPGVTVENRWVPEAEIPELLAWADALVLSHREASQSGVAAAALASHRFLVATRVGGLAEQAGNNPAAVLCDVSAESLAAALRHVQALPPPQAAVGTSAAWAASLVADLRHLAKEKEGQGSALDPLGPAAPDPHS